MQIHIKNKEEENAFFAKLKLKKSAVALGQFDAIHIGHTEIIKRVVDYARKNNTKSLVYMFANDPREVVLKTESKSINSLEQRFDIIKSLGADIVVAREFDKDYMEIEAATFVKEYIADKFGAELVAVGYNYRFGKNGGGDAQILQMLCAEYDTQVCVVPEVKLRGEKVSSSIIREKINNGDVALAAEMMGRPLSIKGVVKRGNHIGTKMGFPTANIELPKGGVIPGYGVYKTRTCIDGKTYASITNVGGKPTVEKDAELIETHIEGAFGELYGKTIEIEFVKFIRDIKKFNSVEELKCQLEQDKKEYY